MDATRSIQAAVAMADIILCSIGQVVVLVLGWSAVVAGVVYMAHKKHEE